MIEILVSNNFINTKNVDMLR